MKFDLVPARRRIRDMVERAIGPTRILKKYRGTVWRKSITSGDGVLTVTITYPPAAKGLGRLRPQYPRWEVRFQGSRRQPSWSLKFGSVGTCIEEGSLPDRLSREMRDDLQAILPS